MLSDGIRSRRANAQATTQQGDNVVCGSLCKLGKFGKQDPSGGGLPVGREFMRGLSCGLAEASPGI